MEGKKVADTPVRVYPATHAQIVQLRLKIAAEIKRPVTMAECVEILARYGEKNYPGLVQEAKRSDK